MPLDSRLLVTYGRDISALTGAEVAALPRPARLSRFPADIVVARGLEFSGIFEDGWLSPQSEFVLAGASAGAAVRLRGYVPELPGMPLGRGTFKVNLNGRDFELPAATGTFDWLLPVSGATTATRVAITPSSTAELPNGDRRPVGAKLDLLEVLPALPGRSFDFATAGALRLAAKGIDQDGWMARRAEIYLPASATATEVTLKLEFPDWSGATATTLSTQISDTPAVSHPLTPGTYSTLRLRVPASAAAQTLRLEAPADFPLPAPDTRRRTGRLHQVDLAPAPDV